MSKIIKLTSNNLFNLNYNTGTFIYPKVFFDKIYTSNTIRNNTIKYNFNLFNNRILSIYETVNHIKNNTIYFLENNEKLLDIIDREKKALDFINTNIEKIENLKSTNNKYILTFVYFSTTQKPTLENNFKPIKKALKDSLSNNYIDDWFYQGIITYLIDRNFVTKYTEDGITYCKIPIIPFILKYNDIENNKVYFLNLIFNVNPSNSTFIINLDDFYSYDPLIETSSDNYYKNVEYAIIKEASLQNNYFVKNTYNFILIGDNIPI